MTYQQQTDIGLYLGSIAIAAGCFLPLTSIPVYGEVTYYAVAELETWIVVNFALITPVLLLLNKRKLTSLSVLAIWVTLLFPAIRGYFKRQLEQQDFTVINQISQAASEPLREFAVDLFMNVTDFHWGGYVFLSGLVLVTVASLLSFFRAR